MNVARNEDIGPRWEHAFANPIAPRVVETAPCQDIVIAGRDLDGPGHGLEALPMPISTPGFDAAPYLTATCVITRDPETGIANLGTYRAQLKSPTRLGMMTLVERPRRRLRALAEIPGEGRADADRDRGRLPAGGRVHGTAEAAARRRRVDDRRGARRRAHQRGPRQDGRSPGAGGMPSSSSKASPIPTISSRKVRSANPTAMWRSRTTTSSSR